MIPPEFFKAPGQWRAEGTITLPLGLEALPFHAIWQGQGSLWTQQVFLEGVHEPVTNAYKRNFGELPLILLESPHLGSLQADLIESDNQIGWEIRSPELSGYEWFQRQPDGSYKHVAEFTGEHGLRTKIESVLRWDSEVSTFGDQE
jgi:hypothetical protein